MEPGYQCLRCGDTFESERILESHLQAVEACTLKKRTETRRFGKEKKEQLKKRCSNRKSDEEKWTEMYGVLFPDDSRVPSAYQDEAVLLELREYAGEMFPRMLAHELKSMVTSGSDLASLPESARENLVRVICTCHENVLRQFQQNPQLAALSETSTGPPALARCSTSILPPATSGNSYENSLADLDSGHCGPSLDTQSLNLDIFSESDLLEAVCLRRAIIPTTTQEMMPPWDD